MIQPFFTILTPVFNGEKHIQRVFDSITVQTFKDFEWIIVDDGSTDNTGHLIKSFIEQHPEISIRYIEQEHNGKHIAWNKGIEKANGKILVPADADDSFLPEALSFFHSQWNALSIKEQKGISGINVLCFDNDSNEIVGPPFPQNRMVTNNLELGYKYKITGEKWGCVRVDLLKLRPFPVVKKGYYPESYLWLHFAKNYQVICFNKPLRRYFTTPTGIIQSSKIKKDFYKAKILIRYNIWFLRNFGFYVLRHSPKVIYQKVKEIISSIIVIIRKSLSRK